MTEDREIVERLKPENQLKEFSVRADAAQLQHRKLRQSFLDMGYGVVPKAANGVTTRRDDPPPASDKRQRQAS